MSLSRLSRALSRVNPLQVVVVTCVPPVPLSVAATCAPTRCVATLSPHPPLYDYKKRRDRRNTSNDNNLGPTQPRNRRDSRALLRCKPVTYGVGPSLVRHPTARAPPMGPPGRRPLAGNSANKIAVDYGCHPSGTTRMSDDHKMGVVDANLKVHGIGNLFICGGSVFPTSGYANPTLTIVALALRLAKHLSEKALN